ncbi:ATP synthase complex assembly protein atp12 [Xylographa opegraphella]|nr:ATP synthase complex assembly protein atp12 [Xylographa opegraphella]
MKLSVSKVPTSLLQKSCLGPRALNYTPLVYNFHTGTPRAATPLPLPTAAGPPPAAPLPAVSQYGERVDRRRRQAELLKRGQDLRASHMKPGSALKKRFWKEVHVKTTPEGHHTVHLDGRPVRAPTTKSVLPIPPSKPHLASAIALEWDLLVSAQQALKQHHLPLTSIASRAYDIALQDEGQAPGDARQEMVTMLMRYLDTDTLLCWAPARSQHDAMQLEESADRANKSLREIQIRVARPIISYLTRDIWPGIEIKPVLDDGFIVPASQPQETKDVIRGWISGLGPWELAALERAVLAGKSLCVAARLVVEWSENFRSVGASTGGASGSPKFGIEEAAEACSLEVNWQTGMWGEVEDSHDVEKEDLRRQFGSVILIVSGTS